MGRRELIADSGVRLIARDGLRALTHLSVDAEARLPRGSTSYYARTRRDLIALVIDRLSDGSQEDIEGIGVPDSLTDADAVALAVHVLDHMALREDAQAARFALMFEVRNDEQLRAALTAQAAVRAPLVETATRLLEAIGTADATQHAVDLVGIVDALLMYRRARAAPVNLRCVLSAYFRGLPKKRD